jgi:hypothetical protein
MEEEERAIDRVAIPYDSEITLENLGDEIEINEIREVVGFGWSSEEKEKEFLLEEFGPEYVEENWKPWDERRKERETE